MNKHSTQLWLEEIFTMLRNTPALVHEAPGYPRNGTSVGVSISGLAHRAFKHVIQALVCWNCTQSVLYTVRPEKSGYGF